MVKGCLGGREGKVKGSAKNKSKEQGIGGNEILFFAPERRKRSDIQKKSGTICWGSCRRGRVIPQTSETAKVIEEVFVYTEVYQDRTKEKRVFRTRKLKK